MLGAIISWLVIGVVAGWLAGRLMSGGGFGFVGNLALGIIGAVVGGLIFSLLGLATTNLIGSIIAATAGAVVFIFVVGLIRRSSSGS